MYFWEKEEEIDCELIERETENVCYDYEETNGCVMGHNMKHMRNLSLEECQAKCTANKHCLGIEYFRYSGESYTSTAYTEGDCLLNDGTDITNPPCDADYYQMYFWKLGK